MMTKTFPIATLLLLMVAMVFVNGFVGEDREEKPEPLSDKEVASQIDILTNEVKRLKTNLHKLTGGEQTSQSGFQILLASRKQLPGDLIRFTVRFKTAHDTSKAHIWRNMDNNMYTLIPEITTNEIPMLPRNVHESSIILPANGSQVLFMCGSATSWLSVFLKFGNGTDVTERNVKIPPLDLEPKGDLVYTPGHNVTLQIKIPPEQERGDPGSRMPTDNFRAEYMLAWPGDEELTGMWNFDGGMEKFTGSIKRVKYLDEIVNSLELNTANGSFGGILTFTAAVNSKNFLGRIEYTKEIVIRPSTRLGPFEENSLFNLTLAWPMVYNEHGDFVRFCQYGKVCMTHCDYIGNNITSVTLYKSVNGRISQAPIKILGEDLVRPYRKTGEFEVAPQRGDVQPVYYTCEGKNGRGRVKNVHFVYYFGTELKMLTNESHIERFENGTAVVTCTAQGDPRPNITIDCNNMTQRDVINKPDGVTSVTFICENVNRYDWMECKATNDVYQQATTYVHM